jgi:hypothetical protein
VSLLEPATLLLRRMPRLCPPSPAEPHVQAFDDPAAYLEHRHAPGTNPAQPSCFILKYQVA